MRDANNTSRLLIPLEEARAMIGVGVTKMYSLIATEKIAARKLGSRTMITSASLHKFVEELPLMGGKSS